MGCATSEFVAHADQPDRCHAVLTPQRQRLETCSSRKAPCPFTDMCKDPGERTYRSYIDTPMVAPEDVSCFPDKHTHEEYLSLLERFLARVASDPNRFEFAIARARWTSYPGTSQMSKKTQRHRPHRQEFESGRFHGSDASPKHPLESSTLTSTFEMRTSVSASPEASTVLSETSGITYRSSLSTTITTENDSFCNLASPGLSSVESSRGSFSRDVDNRSRINSKHSL